ncbi:MAG: hypothetical protein WD688_16380 [Candidatus Binatia bacterium]
MRVTHRTPETLVVEDGPDLLIGSISVGLGSFGILIGWTQGPSWLFVIVGTVFVLAGLRILLLARTRTHRFERWRGLMTIDSKSLWQSERRERELRLDSIADVVLEKKQVKGGETGVRYWVEYVTTQGEHIPWSAFTSSKEDKVECIQAVREFLRIADPPAAANEFTRGG